MAWRPAKVVRSAQLIVQITFWGILASIAGPADASQAEAEALPEEIVVTAQRRPERPEDVPISLTALSGKKLEQLQTTEMATLGNVVPSLVMTRSGAFTQPFLRGIGKRSTLGVENSVATYVDGVYLASSISALLDLRGIDRIEILNGPQGTLFGRNTSGGVIQIITRDPTASRHVTGEAAVHVGNHGFVRNDIYLSAGNDRIAGNLAASLSTNDGFGRNMVTGRTDQGEVDHSLVVRSKWIWSPASHVALTVSADYQDIDHDFSQRPVSGFPALGEPRLQGFRDGDQDSPNQFHFRYGGISAKSDVGLGGAKFTSLSAFRRMRAQYGADLDLGPKLLLDAAPSAKQDQFSQEFQLQSDPSSAIDWLAGVYYFRLKERYDPTSFRYGGAYSDRLGGRIAQTLYSQGKVASYAAYGEASFPIARATDLTAGLRYTIERRSVRARGQQLFDTMPFIRPIAGLPLSTEPPLRSNETFRELTWRGTLAHHFSTRLMGYVSASRGFQSGGWNLQSPQSPSFQPESLIALEAGFKFADRPRRFDIAGSLFYYDYSDLQVSAFTPIGSVTTNAASARLYGAQLQLQAQLDQATTASLGAQILNTAFKRFPNATCTDYGLEGPILYAPVSCDVSGNRLPFAPKFKFNLGLVRTVALGRTGPLVLSANLAFNSGYYSEPDNFVSQSNFAIVNASAEWRMSPPFPSVQLWATNLTDTEHYDALVTFPTTGVIQRPAPPRRVGATLAYAF